MNSKPLENNIAIITNPEKQKNTPTPSVTPLSSNDTHPDKLSVNASEHHELSIYDEIKDQECYEKPAHQDIDPAIGQAASTSTNLSSTTDNNDDDTENPPTKKRQRSDDFLNMYSTNQVCKMNADIVKQAIESLDEKKTYINISNITFLMRTVQI